MTAVNPLSDPQGTERTAGGLIVPKGAGSSILSEHNKRLLDLRESLDVHSLEASLVDQYLTIARYQDQGVTKYKTKLDETQAAALAAESISALAYHVNFRHFRGMNTALVDTLRSITDPAGQTYLETVVKSFFNVDAKSLLDEFHDKDIGVESIAKLGQQLGKSYQQRVVVEALQRDYASDLDKYRQGIKNLNEVFRLVQPKPLETQLKESGLRDLMGTYFSFLEQARSKLSS